MRKLLQHQETEAPSVRDVREVPDEVDVILRRMLAKKPEERFQIPLLVAAALRHFCSGAQATATSALRPPSSAILDLQQRPSSVSGSSRPSTVPNMRPSTATNLKRPSSNGKR